MHWALAVAIVTLGYLIGSFPSAYLIGRAWAHKDLRLEGDGHIGGMAAYRYLGWKGLALVLVLDLGKGVLAVWLATRIFDTPLVPVLTAWAAVAGHCWSVFLRFRGGLGGAVTFAVLAALVTREAFIGLGVFLIVLAITRKTSWGTYILLGTASLALLIEKEPPALIIFPLGLIGLHLLKRFQTRRANPETAYTHEALADLKKFK